MNILMPGLYRHYKGNFYQVLGIARHSETLGEHVVYKSMNGKEGENLWIRPLQMFMEQVSLNGVQVPRFSFVKP